MSGFEDEFPLGDDMSSEDFEYGVDESEAASLNPDDINLDPDTVSDEEIDD
jgi:hypothetical protein